MKAKIQLKPQNGRGEISRIAESLNVHVKVPWKHAKRARIWSNDNSCVRLRSEYKNHVWSYDFVSEQTHDGRKLKILNVVDEFTRECLLSLVKRRIRSQDVIFALADLFLKYGAEAYQVRQWFRIYRDKIAAVVRKTRSQPALY